VGGNPVNFVDPEGLEKWSFGVDVSIPIKGGFGIGLFVTDGKGDAGGSPDMGFYFQTNSPHDGPGSLPNGGKLKFGPTIAQSFEGRGDALQTNYNLYAGFILGASLTGPTEYNECASEVTGWQIEQGVIGAGLDITTTSSISVGDLGRLAAAIVTGDYSQGIFGAQASKCGCGD
jgi:hypothetical protein